MAVEIGGSGETEEEDLLLLAEPSRLPGDSIGGNLEPESGRISSTI